MCVLCVWLLVQLSTQSVRQHSHIQDLTVSYRQQSQGTDNNTIKMILFVHILSFHCLCLAMMVRSCRGIAKRFARYHHSVVAHSRKIRNSSHHRCVSFKVSSPDCRAVQSTNDTFADACFPIIESGLICIVVRPNCLHHTVQNLPTHYHYHIQFHPPLFCFVVETIPVTTSVSPPPRITILIIE